MTLTLTFAWWWIPAAITFVAFLWLLLGGDSGPDTFGIGATLRLGAFLIVSLLAFAIAGFFK